jgi:hypoxia up-regulated 1
MLSNGRLVSLDKLDQNRAAREEALNSLEAYIYKSRDFLEDSVFQKVSSKDERKSLKEKIEAASEWLFSSDSATFEDFKSRLAELT